MQYKKCKISLKHLKNLLKNILSVVSWCNQYLLHTNFL